MSRNPAAPAGVLTLPDLLDEQVARTPDALAIVYQGEQFTYREFQERVNRTANFLLGQGVGRGARVGLMVQRGVGVVENILLLFGILKAGAAYVPLEASLPPERLSFILRDAAISLVLTQHPLAAGRAFAFQAASPTRVLCIDELRDELARADKESPPDDALPDERAPAYILYTTGSSTGIPKGVVVGHRSLGHFARVQNEALSIGPGERTTFFFSLAFDASLSDLIALAAGATLYPIPPEALLGGHALLDFLQENAITVATFVPSFWMKLPTRPLPALRLLVLGGEVCPASVVQKSWRPGLRIVNAFGLTETTVCFTLGECDAAGAAPNIGKPFPGIEVSIRDKRLSPVPPGVVGQICVGGECLALGYTDPDLTAQRFVPDPLAPERRVFLTHDLGTMDAEGTLTFLERLDKTRRLKLTGARLVDLDEIEALLWQNPHVKECAVEDFQGRIVAFVTLAREALEELSGGSEEERERKEREIRLALDGYLRQHLFDYMRPKTYVLLPSQPRTTSDKIDRNALRHEVVITWSVGEGVPVQASTALERQLAEIVAEMMTIEMQRFSLLGSLVGDETETPQDLPVVTWEQVDVARAATDQGEKSLDSLEAPAFALRGLQRCGVDLDNREFFVPLALVASAIEFLQYEQARSVEGGKQ
jgi:amino acid adenylation domain-containing protein